MRIIFLGTPDFAVPALEALELIPSCEIVKVITQPDKKTGRKQMLTPPPVKAAAEKLGIKVSQPGTKKDLEKEIEEKVDFLVVIAYGMILTDQVLQIPKYGAINVHASLLPKYRGASPIQESLLNGDKETGVTIMKIDKELDHGPIYALKRVQIENNDSLETLTKKLAIEGAQLLPPILRDIYEDGMRPIPQKHEQATHCRKIQKKDGKIDFKKTAKDVFNMIRAYTPWPSAYTEFKGKKIKILRATYEETNSDKSPGTFYTEDKILKIATKKGVLIPTKVQVEGKKEMTERDFINSNQAHL